MAAIRIGSPDSPVTPGTPVPGKPGQYYEAGQFAPSLDELATSTFAEASESGLISSELPIFDDDGKVDAGLVEQWNPRVNLPGMNISSQVTKFSLAVLATVNMSHPDILKNLGIGAILDGAALEQQEGVKAIMGESLITVKANARLRTFSASFYIHPKYQQYVSTPVVAEIPGRTKGISVAMFATYKAIGHALFLKMTHEQRLELIGKFMNASEWSKTTGERGVFLGRKNMGSYLRNPEQPKTSEIATYSPIDDFSDTFAHYMAHRIYLSKLHPQKLIVMDEINDIYRLV